jgi:hypothetical protein
MLFGFSSIDFQEKAEQGHIQLTLDFKFNLPQAQDREYLL